MKQATVQCYSAYKLAWIAQFHFENNNQPEFQTIRVTLVGAAN